MSSCFHRLARILFLVRENTEVCTVNNDTGDNAVHLKSNQCILVRARVCVYRYVFVDALIELKHN